MSRKPEEKNRSSRKDTSKSTTKVDSRKMTHEKPIQLDGIISAVKG